jgi:hypothetical protein
MTVPLERVVAGVRANCHVSDARHARNLTLCTYLLEMRDLYRWEHGIDVGEPLPRADVGAWIAAREALWESLGDASYEPIPTGSAAADPFAVEVVNAALVPAGHVYGAGVGRFGKPQFFVAELARAETRDGLRVLVAGRELARDLSPAPAALRGDTVYVRLEALERWLWGKTEMWAVKRAEGPLQRALDAWGFAEGARPALARMTAAEAETLILHEQGEHQAGRMLGPEWEAMLAGLSRRRAELVARAARDHLADCLVTLPALLDRGAAASIHFWFANLDGMRRELFPRIRAAYASWCGGDGGQALRAAVAAGAIHWEEVCRRILALRAGEGSGVDAAVEALGDDATARLGT